MVKGSIFDFNGTLFFVQGIQEAARRKFLSGLTGQSSLGPCIFIRPVIPL